MELTHRILGRFALALLLIPMYAAAEDTITPGLYQTTINTEMQMGDMKMPPRSMQRESCITAEDVANGPPLPNPDGQADCEVEKYEFGGGKFSMEMACSMGQGAGTMVGTGSYTSDSYEMKTHMKMKAQGMEVEVKSKATGVRVKDC